MCIRDRYYGDVIREAGAEVEIIFANDCRAILEHTKNVLTCDIHTRVRTKRILRQNGAERVLGLDDILSAPVNGSGCNENYGLLGSNKSTEDTVKLFPRDCGGLVEEIQSSLLQKTGKHVEVMVYGDGAFKDPVGKIWELADPCVSVANTPGLEGTPNEVKLKYLADNDFKNLSGEALKEAISGRIKEKKDKMCIRDRVLGEGHFNFPVLNLNLDFFHLRSVCRIAGFLKLSAAGRTPGKHPGREQDAEACDGKPGGIVAFFRFGKFHHKSVPPGFEKVDIDVSLC